MLRVSWLCHATELGHFFWLKLIPPIFVVYLQFAGSTSLLWWFHLDLRICDRPKTTKQSSWSCLGTILDLGSAVTRHHSTITELNGNDFRFITLWNNGRFYSEKYVQIRLRTVDISDFHSIIGPPIYQLFFTWRFVSSGWQRLIYSRLVHLSNGNN